MSQHVNNRASLGDEGIQSQQGGLHLWRCLRRHRSRRSALATAERAHGCDQRLPLALARRTLNDDQRTPIQFAPRLHAPATPPDKNVVTMSTSHPIRMRHLASGRESGRGGVLPQCRQSTRLVK